MFYRHESFPSSSSQSFFFNAPAPDQYTLQTFRGYSPYYAATGQNGFNPPIYDPFENRLVYPTNVVADCERQVRSVENYRSGGPVDSSRGPVDSGRGPVDSTTAFCDSEDRWKLTEVPDVPSKSVVASINDLSNERIETLKQAVLQERQTMKKTRPKRIAAQPEAREQWMKKRARLGVPDNLVKNQTTKRTKTH